MYRLVVLLALATLSAGQSYHNDPRTAAILSEQRFLSADGTFGAAYKQEDGVEFKEESDAEGNRRGSYSYVDPSGQRRTVSYVAGKNGFQASGAHIPVAPAPVAPQPQYQPLPQYNPPPQPQSQPQQQPQYNPPAPQPQYRPQPQYNPPPPQPQQYQPQPQYNPPAQQPQYNNYQPQPNAIPRYNPTTPPPHRFFPPGKLNLNRTPDGFSYTFNKS